MLSAMRSLNAQKIHYKPTSQFVILFTKYKLK